MENKPKKMYFVYGYDENGNKVVKELVSIYADRTHVKEAWDSEKHLKVINEFFADNGIEASGADAFVEAEEKKIFKRFNEKDLTPQNVYNFVGPELMPSKYDLPNDMIYEGEPEEEDIKEDNKTGKKILAGALAGVATLGLATAIHESKKEDVDLYDGMTDKQKEFFEDTFEAMEDFNKKATKDNNFKLAEDATELHLTVEEAVALRIVMNNYSADDLIKIFGTTSLDTATIMEHARSAYSKLSTYYMNAKEPSGLARLINDKEARNFFEEHESYVTEFNINPSTDLANLVITNTYNDYIVDGTNGRYAEIENPGVAWFATSAVHGYELANRNMPEFLVNDQGISLSQVTTSELLTGINEEIPLDILDAVDAKSLCALVTSKTNEKLLALQTAITVVKTTSSPEVVSRLEKTEKFIQEKMDKAQKKIGKSVDTDIAQLVNNRFRTPEKLKAQQEGVSREEFDKMTKEQQKDFIKNNGKVIGTSTSTTETKVDESSLTPSEKVQVEADKKVQQEIEKAQNQLIESGVREAIEYTDKKGGYDFTHDEVTIPGGKTENLDSKSLFNGISYGLAFGDDSVKQEVSAISSSSSQIQSAMEESSKDDEAKLKGSLSPEAIAALEKKYGSDWVEDVMDISYEYGFEKQVDGSIAKAKELSSELKKGAQDAYEQAQSQIKKEEVPEQVTPVTPEVTPEVTPLPYDPNIDPNYKQPDEIPVDETKYQRETAYIPTSDSLFDNAYIEQPVKTK